MVRVRNFRPLEKDIQATILAYLAVRQLCPIRLNSGAFAGTYKGKRRYVRFASVPGVSDIHATLSGGRACWIECKRPGERPTPDQQRFLEDQARAGALCIVAESVDDVIQAIEDAT